MLLRLGGRGTPTTRVERRQKRMLFLSIRDRLHRSANANWQVQNRLSRSRRTQSTGYRQQRRPVYVRPLSRLSAGILAGKSRGLPAVVWHDSCHWPAVDQWFPNNKVPLKFESARPSPLKNGYWKYVFLPIKHYRVFKIIF